jgi:protein TonB
MCGSASLQSDELRLCDSGAAGVDCTALKLKFMRRNVMDSTTDGAGPQAAASVASPAASGAGDLSLVVPRGLRQAVPAVETEGADLSNVVPFLRRKGDAHAASQAPALAAKPEQRPAPIFAGIPSWLKATLAAAAAAHAGVFVVMLLLNLEPKELPSVGQQPISVELVLGADTAEGVAPTQGPDAEEAPPPQQALDAPDEIKPDEPKPIEQQTEPPKETPPVETAEAPPPDTPPPTPSLPPPPVEIEAPTQAAPAEVAAAPEIQPEKPDVPTMQVTPLPKAEKPIPQPKPKPRVAVRGRPNDSRTREPELHQANGIGRGRSFNNANYAGLVIAHLQRYKGIGERAVTEQNDGRRAIVTFSLDGSGHVHSVSLMRSSGAPALDRAILAMVHSASPFPAPPGHQAKIFSVPVSFAMPR